MKAGFEIEFHPWITGTGFECADSAIGDDSPNGSSTGWLSTAWSIEPNESFTLTIHIHDTSDPEYDSEVILDNFRWYTEPMTGGTIEIE